MKYKTLTILFLTVTLFGGFVNNRCSSGNPVCGVSVSDDPSDEMSVDPAFMAFIDSVPIVRLTGFELRSDQAFEHVDIESKFIPEGAALVGRLLPFNPSKHHEFIIYSYAADIRLPILEVYNAKGEKVNQRQLFLYGSCPVELEDHHTARLSEDFTKFYLETYCSTNLSNRKLDTIIIHDLIPH